MLSISPGETFSPPRSRPTRSTPGAGVRASPTTSAHAARGKALENSLPLSICRRTAGGEPQGSCTRLLVPPAAAFLDCCRCYRGEDWQMESAKAELLQQVESDR